MVNCIDEIFNNMPCGFVSFRDDGSIETINSTLLLLLGYKVEELENKTFQILLPFASRVFFQTHFFPILKLHGKAEEIYFSLKSKDGKDIPMLVNGVRREKEEIKVNDCVFIPIRQRIQYEDEILKAKKEAERVTRELQKAQIEMKAVYKKLQIELLERKRADKIISHQTAREILLRNMTEKIHESQDLSSIFNIATNGIRYCFNVDRVGIFKFYSNSNFSKGKFICESLKENVNSMIDVEIEDTYFGEKYALLYQHGKIHVIENIDLTNFTDYHRNFLTELQIKSHVIVPLLKGEYLWGFLCIHQCSKVRHWQEFEIYFIKQLANQLAIAIQQKDLFQQLQKKLIEQTEIENQLKKTNENLLIANRELERVTNAKSEFLANMSHEIRTPMNGVLSMAQLLLTTDLSLKQKDIVQTILDSGDSLLVIINDILDLSKIQSGMLELEEQPFVLKDIIKSVCRLFQQKVSAKEIELNYFINPDVPTYIIGDRTRLRQILLNLVSNSIKFTHEGEIFLLVSSELLSEGKYKIRISIRDTGIGIDKNYLTKLFQSFTQADVSISRQYGGTGLGLAICQNLVKLMGGQIWVESNGRIGGNPPENWFPILDDDDDDDYSPQGSIFHFTFITKAVSSSDLGMKIFKDFSQQSYEIIEKKLPLKILVAEDYQPNQKVIMYLLESLGYTADIVNNGLEVLEILEKQSYDVILMDMQMPKMDGIITTKKIRQLYPFQPYIIALTANALEEHRQKCLEVGMDDYISKPISIDKMKQVLDKIQYYLSNV